MATIPDTEVHYLRSDVTGHEYRISVGYATGFGAPSPASPEQTFPVVYVLDADGAFGTAIETARMMQLGRELPPLLVVGIGYPVARFAETYDLRMRDYTPTSDTSFVRITREFQGGGAGSLPGDDRRSGGGDAFLRFIQDQLKPFIEERYAADPADATLVGHSFGGLFGVWVLLTQAQTFRRYVLGSPGLFWDDQVAFELEERHATSHDDLVADVFLAAGALESQDDNKALLEVFPDALQRQVEEYWESIDGPLTLELMLPFSRALAARDYRSLRLTTHVFEGETHNSVPPLALGRGLRVVFGRFKAR